MLVGEAVNTYELDVGYPLLEQSTGGEYRDVIRLHTLNQHAAADLKALSNGQFAPTFKVRSDVAPLPGEYFAGDHARFRLTSCIHRAREDGSPGFDGVLRITGIEVTPERPGRAGEVRLSTNAVEGS